MDRVSVNFGNDDIVIYYIIPLLGHITAIFILTLICGSLRLRICLGSRCPSTITTPKAISLIFMSGFSLQMEKLDSILNILWEHVIILILFSYPAYDRFGITLRRSLVFRL